MRKANGFRRIGCVMKMTDAHEASTCVTVVAVIVASDSSRLVQQGYHISIVCFSAITKDNFHFVYKHRLSQIRRRTKHSLIMTLAPVSTEVDIEKLAGSAICLDTPSTLTSSHMDMAERSSSVSSSPTAAHGKYHLPFNFTRLRVVLLIVFRY